MKKLIIIAMAIMLVFGAVGCQNSNPLMDPTNPMNPMNPNSPLNPNNPNNQGNKFPVSEATDAIVDIINGLDKAKIAKDAGTLVQGMLSTDITTFAGEETGVTGMALSFAFDYNGKTYNTIDEFIEALEAADVTVDSANPGSAILNADKIAVTLTFSGYINGVKENLAALTSGSVTLTANPQELSGGTASLDLSIANLGAAMKDGTTYTIVSASNMAVVMDDTGMKLPPAKHSASFTVSNGKTSQSVTWNAIVSSEKNDTPSDSYTDIMPDEAATIGFYSHLGYQRFLLALYDAFGEGHGELTISNMGSIGITINDEYEGEYSFTLTLALNGYHYYKNGTTQAATGRVTMIFYGDVENDNTFTAKNYSITSDNLTLSDTATTGKHGNAYITFPAEDPVTGVFGSAEGNGSIIFTTATDDTDSSMTITGIKHYGNEQDETADNVVYDPEQHEFVLNGEYPEISLN